MPDAGELVVRLQAGEGSAEESPSNEIGSRHAALSGLVKQEPGC
jgi:hypothetical protein